MNNKIITIFGSSRPVESDEEYRLAFTLGKHLAQGGFTVCNGGFAGIMEASARGAKEAHGSTIGVTVNAFQRKA
ncbi:MAG TPA: LOG family protein, partial [Bacteroidota bacterium]